MLRRVVRIFRNAAKVRLAAGAPIHQQLADLAFFRQAIKASPLEFYRYRLWDRTRPIAERLAYLTFGDHRIIEGALHPVDAVNRLNDKIVTAERFRSAGIPMPRVAGIFDARSGEAGVITTAGALALLAGQPWPNGLVIKPNHGQSGKQIMVFRRVDPVCFTRLDGQQIPVNELAAWLSRQPYQRWTIEERLLQHPDLANVAPDVLATVRLLTLRAPDGEVSFGPAVWKIPIDLSGVDNFSANGLAAPIDLATGRIGDAVDIHGRKRLASHPVSGVRFSDITLPGLPAALGLAKRASAVIAEFATIGWDIALTADGAYLIEGNAWWSATLLQMPHGRGMMRDSVVSFLQAHGLVELLDRRERAEREWQRRFGRPQAR
ncbi:MAG: sugar-transfer associated ATP-grasp domain-containing protein [Gemmatimonadota bacterium]